MNHSFFIFIDFLEPNTAVYKNLICLHKKENRENFNFSNIIRNLRGRIYIKFFTDLNFLMYSSSSLKFSITFKDTPVLEYINSYIINVMKINIIHPQIIYNIINNVNLEQTFKEDECVICLTNPPNVLFCNCGHIAICIECNKMKSLENCPVCKTENIIKRTIYY